MTSTPIADTVRTRDLLVLARAYQRHPNHALYWKANEIDQRENDVFIRTLETKPDMSLAGLQQMARSESKAVGVIGMLATLGSGAFMVSSVLAPPGMSLPLMAFGITVGALTIAAAGRMAGCDRFAHQLTQWENSLEVAANARAAQAAQVAQPARPAQSTLSLVA